MRQVLEIYAGGKVALDFWIGMLSIEISYPLNYIFLHHEIIA